MIAKVIFEAQKTAGDIGFLAPVIENHDEPRGVSTYLPLMWQNSKGAKSLGTVNLTLNGVPFVFQCQELGMLNTKFDNIDELDDCQSKDQYQMCQEQGLSETVTISRTMMSHVVFLPTYHLCGKTLRALRH